MQFYSDTNKMSFNADELEAPEWVNSNFLKEVLEYNGDLKNVTVRKLISYAKAGDCRSYGNVKVIFLNLNLG